MGFDEDFDVTGVFDERVVLFTGGARALGATVVRAFHHAGARVCIHYERAANEAMALASELEDARPRSVRVVRGNLGAQAPVRDVIMDCIRGWGRLDVLIHTSTARQQNACAEVTPGDVADMIDMNFRAPLYLAQFAERYLEQEQGAILNLLDMPAADALGGHCLYAPATAALEMLTRVQAVDLAPRVRANALITDLAALRPTVAPSDDDSPAAPPPQLLAVAQRSLVLCDPATPHLTGCIEHTSG